MLVAACRARETDTAGRAAIDDRPSVRAAAPSPDPKAAFDTGKASTRIRIAGPTLIMAIKRSLPGEALTSQEANEALSDFGYYFGRAATFLEKRGVQATVAFADTLVLEQDKADSAIVVNEGQPLYYFAMPGKQPIHLIGADSDHDLLTIAADYFWANNVPPGRGDTLTPATATADFVVTRPTIIAYFSRRSLDIAYRGHGPSPAEYPDSARLVRQVDSLKDSLGRAGIGIDLTFNSRFTVLVRGRVDTIALVPSGRRLGYYVASPEDWRTHYIDSFRATPELLGEIAKYFDHRAPGPPASASPPH